MKNATQFSFFLSPGKLVVRDRIQLLLDPQTPFLELSQLAAHGMYGDDDVPAAGIVTGVGTVRGWGPSIICKYCKYFSCKYLYI